MCNTDLGLPVSYTVTLADLGTTIINNAVVTVRTQEATPTRVPGDGVDRGRRPAATCRSLRSWRATTRRGSATARRATRQPVQQDQCFQLVGGCRDTPDHAEDIIPPGPWGPGQNYDPDNGAIWLNDCRNIGVMPLIRR